ncbi:MAG: dephospho-CoA kinase [Chloroflexota bacterium]|jgi:dephospho-CoA kinase|nr:MAG: dephospho-CoA kinase [Chloroflexota bacterium]|tara:strand:+ start:579 stop:1184 length:606 start_codon:yes stop_codon:yes gene_type:complete
MIVIGLTGGIGTGKSEVARILEEIGAYIIDADRLGHSAYLPHSEIWEEVVKEFGDGVLLPDEEIDRKKLGSIVFNDPVQLAKLNEIMHPRMGQMVANIIEGLDAEVVVVEAALLLEAGWDALVDEVWCTGASEDVVIDRLKARNGLNKEEAQKRINAQMSVDERKSRSQVMIENNGDLAQLTTVIEQIWENRVITKVEKGR